MSLSSSSTAISSPTTITTTPSSNERSHEESPTEDKSPSPASSARELHWVKAVNFAAADRVEFTAGEGRPNSDSDFQESYWRPLEARWVASTTSTEKYPKQLQLNTSNTDIQLTSTYKRRFLLERFGMTESASNSSNTDIQLTYAEQFLNHWALLRQSNGKYYGTKATLNVYGLPEVGPQQGSGAMIWLANGVDTFPDAFNVIKAGWHVFPAMGTMTLIFL